MAFIQWNYLVHDQMDQPIAGSIGPEECAMLVACLGDGYSIVAKNRKVWREGEESQPASESYDFVADTVFARERQHKSRSGRTLA